MMDEPAARADRTTPGQKFSGDQRAMTDDIGTLPATCP
jgi:hypothetical protein